eukprot:6201244-Pleurochrysis_carterae.AAC.3
MPIATPFTPVVVHMPIPVAAGDIVSYNIYYVSVPDAHSGQQYVINFHDNHLTLTLPPSS